ncbi:uncharacterized protein LOC112590116 [Harpegnathos saltator]|uniref:uncharacterized protein LOC112590116 n=1 Tax=Harpegnathos saltator TaxID=610380 RepID=UPI000DBED821|nr:uncharacterized protein LOC112590116 [Harpegnathos saltator]
MVMQKLRPWALPLTETLDSRFLGRVMGTLFPVGGDNPITPYVTPSSEHQGEVPGVTEEEVAEATKGVKSRKAPGPDGIPGRVLTLASGYMSGTFVHLFTRALRERRFPPVWGRANVVLLRKEGKPEDSPSAYLPICLLDEAGKLFERIIAARPKRHMSREGPDLGDGQYGFREGRSTVDAVLHLKSLSGAIVSEGRVAVAISLDIANAFNTLPWDRVVQAMRSYFRFPPYLTAVVEDYFRDDTLVLAGGRDWGEAVHTANLAVAAVMRSIRNLGLVVAERKTEAIFLHAKGMKPPQAHVRIGQVRVPIEAQMKMISINLGRLMPNVGGPDMKARRLHAGVLNSVAMYGAPVWAESLAASRPMQARLRRVQRGLAVRVARCYRTVSCVAATVLASMPPMELVALSYKRMYDRKRELLRAGGRTYRSPGQSGR